MIERVLVVIPLTRRTTGRGEGGRCGVIKGDILLADRCLKEAPPSGHNGKPFTSAGIGSGSPPRDHG